MRAVVRRLALVALCGMPILHGAPGVAQDEEEGSVYPDDWPRTNKLAAGLNAVITAPADPVMFSIEGDEVFDEFWHPQVTGRMMGAVAGLLQFPYRLITGAFDMITAPLAPVMYMVSPAPRFHLIPHLHDEE